MNCGKKLLGESALAVCLLATLACTEAMAQQWDRFLGPSGNAESSSAKLPLSWDAETNIKWKSELPGYGASSPIVVGDRIFLTCYSGYGTGAKGNIKDLVRHLLCFDRSNGDMLWKKSVDNSEVEDEDPYKSFITHHGYATNTPVSDGESVFVFFGKPGLFAFDLDGNELWKKKIDYRTNKTRWGSAASPILYKDNLILNSIEENGKVLSISKSNGEIQWEFDAQTKLAYSTPNLVTTEDGEVELVLPVPTRVIGLNPDDGTQKWFVNNRFENESNASPIVDGDIVYIYGGFRSVGSQAIRVGGKGDVTDSHVLWTTRDTSYVSTPILEDEHLYWIDESGIAYCVKSESGEVVYKKRVPGVLGGRGIKFFASMVLAGDRMYAVSRRSGTFVIETKPEFSLLSHNKIEDDDSEFNGTPAVIGNEMYVRSNRYLYCVAE